MTGRLEDKCGLIVGIANQDSIAAGCARSFSNEGARLAITYLNDKARPHVASVAEGVGAEIFAPLDVTDELAMDTVFETIKDRWGRLDFVLHSVAYCPKDDLHGRVIDSSSAGFGLAVDVSCHSFLRLARRAEPLMIAGGTLMTVSFYGAEKVVDDYNIMGPVKAALEACVRYAAAELGPARIRVHGLSPGPVATRAASGIAEFNAMLKEAADRSPLPTEQTPDDVGALASFLISDDARHMTGNIIHVDAGYHVMA